LSTIGREIDALTERLPLLDKAETMARHEFKRAYNRAFLMAEGSVDAKRALAEEQSSTLELEWSLAGVEMRRTKEELRALRDRLEIGRSLSAIMRLEWAGRD
jgi:ribosomal protein S12 methylthiotransferase accessory factor YcaO